MLFLIFESETFGDLISGGEFLRKSLPRPFRSLSPPSPLTPETLPVDRLELQRCTDIVFYIFCVFWEWFGLFWDLDGWIDVVFDELFDF